MKKVVIIVLMIHTFLNGQEKKVNWVLSWAPGVHYLYEKQTFNASQIASINYQTPSGWGGGISFGRFDFTSDDYRKNIGNDDLVNPPDEPISPNILLISNDDPYAALDFWAPTLSYIYKDRFLIKLGLPFITVKDKRIEYVYFGGFPGTFSGGGSGPRVNENIRELPKEKQMGIYFDVAYHGKIWSWLGYDVGVYQLITKDFSLTGIKMGLVVRRF